MFERLGAKSLSPPPAKSSIVFPGVDDLVPVLILGRTIAGTVRPEAEEGINPMQGGATPIRDSCSGACLAGLL